MQTSSLCGSLHGDPDTDELLVCRKKKKKKVVSVANGLNPGIRSQVMKYLVGRSSAAAHQPLFFVAFHKAKAQDSIISPQIVSVSHRASWHVKGWSGEVMKG